jgi:leucyl-tRNA synthetase
MPRYNPAEIEPKWQQYWDANHAFAAPRRPTGEKLYALDMFPYPSGDGLHVGHPEGYTATDIVCRYARMCGKSVMHPMGFDAFGLPAEEHAIKTGQHPRIQTEANIATFRRQLKMLGFSYDWQRELATTDVAYVRWTQWIFLQIFDTWFDTEQQRGRPIAELPIPAEVAAEGEDAVRRYQDARRLAFQSEAPVNWCPALGTVLANEEVIDGKSERGGHPVVRMPLRQWMLRITAYADRLENDLVGLDWSESIKALQRNWIGRSTGAEVDFYIGDDHLREQGRPPAEAFAEWKASRAKAGLPEQPGDEVLRIYTTRPDTLFGATYMVIAPEHPAVKRLTTPDRQAEVAQYCERAATKSDLDRTELAKEKTGVFTGSYATNPVNGWPVPVWIADYVLISYGTGAIMAVPAHDDRDFEFAQQFGIPITAVVEPPTHFASGFSGVHPDTQETLSTWAQHAYHDWKQSILDGKKCYTGNEVHIDLGTTPDGTEVSVSPMGEGRAINSGQYDGLTTSEFKEKIAADLTEGGLGSSAVNYKLRDWLFSRQRFWGEPFPIMHQLDDDGNPTGLMRAVDASELPVDLPHLDDFKPHGRPEPPLDKAPDDWLYPVIDGVRYKRETNTMPQWAGSCWYYLRFLDPGNDTALIDPAVERDWMPVDLYVGGAEHAVLHLLYARFWHKVLYDRGVVSTVEPFQKLINQGMILGEVEMTGYRDSDEAWVSAADVKAGEDGTPVRQSTGEPLTAVRVDKHEAVKQGEGFVLESDPAVRLDSRAHKMSKSRGNVVNPDAVVKQYGADSLRLYEMFMGPLEATKPWSMEGVSGVRGFLDRAWRVIVDERDEQLALHPSIAEVEPNEEQARVLHRTIQAVTHDLDAMSFNTAIARMMEFTNFFMKQDVRPKAALESFVLLLAPFAPHLAEELWQLLGHSETLAYEPWPSFDEAAIKEDSVEIPVQIEGKVRAKIQVAADLDKAGLEAAAMADPRVQELIHGKEIVKAIVVPGRLVNFVVK